MFCKHMDRSADMLVNAGEVVHAQPAEDLLGLYIERKMV